MQTTLDIDPHLFAVAKRAAAQVGKPLSAVVEDSLKPFLNKEKPVLQAPPGGYRGDSLDRDDLFFLSWRKLKRNGTAIHHTNQCLWTNCPCIFSTRTA